MALRGLGHRTFRLGNPHDLLSAVGQGRLPPLDAVLTIAEGYGGRNREAWVPLLCEMAGVPVLGSDGLTLSTTLDKAWAHRVVAGAGVPVPPHRVMASPGEAATGVLPAPFPLFVKPRWEGTAKGIRPTSRVEDRAGLVQEVAYVTAHYRQPALVEAFVGGPEYTVTLVGNGPPGPCPFSSGPWRPGPASGSTRSSATPLRPAGGDTSCRARSTRSWRPVSSSWPPGPSRPWSAVTSPGSTSAWTRRGRRGSWRSTPCRPSPSTARSGSSPSCWAGRSTICWPRSWRGGLRRLGLGT